MGLTVETGYLRGYANQIDGDWKDALYALNIYCAKYCYRDSFGLDGLLTLVQFAVQRNTESFMTLKVVPQ